MKKTITAEMAEYFKHHKVDELYFCSDGSAKFKLESAQNHARNLLAKGKTDEVTHVTREEAEAFLKESESGEGESGKQKESAGGDKKSKLTVGSKEAGNQSTTATGSEGDKTGNALAGNAPANTEAKTEAVVPAPAENKPANTEGKTEVVVPAPATVEAKDAAKTVKAPKAAAGKMKDEPAKK